MANDENGRGGQAVIGGVLMPEAENKVEDVFNSIQSFGSLMAMLTGLLGGMPIPAILGAQWLGVYLHKLVEWGAITEAERDQVFAKMSLEKSRVEAQIRAQQEAVARGEEPDQDTEVGRFLEQFGI